MQTEEITSSCPYCLTLCVTQAERTLHLRDCYQRWVHWQRRATDGLWVLLFVAGLAAMAVVALACFTVVHP